MPRRKSSRLARLSRSKLLQEEVAKYQAVVDFVGDIIESTTAFQATFLRS